MEIKNVKLGNTQLTKIYVGENLSWMYEAPDVTAPITSVYPDPVAGTHYAGQAVRFEVNEMCDTYYTLDGSTPTIGSTKYTDAFILNQTTTIKYFSVDIAGNVETVKTTVFDITGGITLPVTTISPSATVQNNFPITVTLSATDATATYYKIGTGTQQTYTAPFTVSQTDVWLTDILVTYWSVGADGTETEKTITYDTSAALPAQPVLIATAGDNQVDLDWTAGSHQNAIAYTVYRSTVDGQAGEVLLGTYSMSGTTWTDSTALNDTTYYYMVQAGNMGQINNSAQVAATPIAEVAPLPVTTISPSATVQNSISVTVTLSATNATTTYYKIGTGGQQTYSAPFTVFQWSAGVTDDQIPITYWSVGANGTEAERTITYDTSGAIPSKVVVTPTNNANQVVLNWTSATNTTAYSVYRSQSLGTLGTAIVQYLGVTTYTDNTAVGGETYYYTVRSQNYSANYTDSDQVTGIPTGGAATWRYLKIQGYGATEAGQEATTRLIEFQAWAGATNVLTGLPATSVTWDTPNNGTVPAKTTIFDGVFTTTSNTYPFWWTATPNANVVIDLGSQKALTKLNWFGYSTGAVQRANRFNILASNTNNGSDWVNIWNMQTNTTMQPILPSGNYEKVL